MFKACMNHFLWPFAFRIFFFSINQPIASVTGASTPFPGKCSETTARSLIQSRCQECFISSIPRKLKYKGTSVSSGEGKGLRIKKVKVSLWEQLSPITKNHRANEIGKDRKVNPRASAAPTLEWALQSYQGAQQYRSEDNGKTRQINFY